MGTIAPFSLGRGNELLYAEPVNSARCLAHSRCSVNSAVCRCASGDSDLYSGLPWAAHSQSLCTTLLPPSASCALRPHLLLGDQLVHHVAPKLVANVVRDDAAPLALVP